MSKECDSKVGPTLLLLTIQWGGITLDLHISIMAFCITLNTVTGGKLFGFFVWGVFVGGGLGLILKYYSEHNSKKFKHIIHLHK